MDKNVFWETVDQRSRENEQIAVGGMPHSLASLMEWVGLRFLWVGSLVSGVLALFLWLFRYQALVGVVRSMIWR